MLKRYNSACKSETRTIVSDNLPVQREMKEKDKCIVILGLRRHVEMLEHQVNYYATFFMPAAKQKHETLNQC